MLGGRRGARGQHAHERLVGVGGLEQRLQVGRPAFGGERGVDGAEDAARDGQQVRRERDGHRPAGGGGEFLLDLRDVAMAAADLVGPEAVRDLAEQGGHAGGASGAAGAGLGVDDQGGRVDQAAAQERRQREDHRGRVAARIGGQPGGADALAVEFGQAVDRLGEQFRAGVLRVPGLVDPHVVQPVVGAQVHHLFAGGKQLGDDVHGRLVGHGGEEEIGPVDQLRRTEVLADDLHPLAQVREYLGQRLARVLPRGGHGDFDFRVPGEQTGQFNPGVSGCADNTHTQHDDSSLATTGADRLR